MPAQHHLHYLTLIHQHATQLSSKYLYTKHQLYKYWSFAEKNAFRRPYWRPFYDSLWCQPVINQNIFTAAHPLTESTFKTYIHNTFYINIDLFQNKSHFGGHLGGHLEFLETLHDASPASFSIFKSNMSSNIINNKKTIYSNAGSNLEWTGLVGKTCLISRTG